MYRLVYSSIETDPFDKAALKKLLLASRLRNREAEVTGMLIYDAGIFLQALEGSEDAVQATFCRIEADPRHHNVSILSRDDRLRERSFGNWSMGFSDVSGAAAMLRGFVSLSNGLKTPVLDRANAEKILQRFATG